MKRKDQINWLLTYCIDHNLMRLDAEDLELESAFIEATGVELSRKQWVDRLLACAVELGMRYSMTVGVASQDIQFTAIKLDRGE